MPDVYVVRHAQTDLTFGHPHPSRPDPTLTELGERQAEALGRWLAAQARPSAIYTSDMRRALLTAERIQPYLEVPLIPEVRLREVGGWSQAGFPRDLTTPDPAHVSETWADFYTRVLAFCEELVLWGGESPLLVTHGGVFDVLIARSMNFGPSQTITSFIYNTGITHFRMDEARIEVILHNRVDHLTEDLLTF